MENYIYRLALVTLNEIEEMTPYYFADKESALAYAKQVVSTDNNYLNNLFEEYCHCKHGHGFHSCFFREGQKIRWYTFELIYKDNRVSYDRFIAITRIPLLRIE